MFIEPRKKIKDPNFDIINKDNLKQIYYLEKLLKEAPYSDDKANDFKQFCWTAFVNGECVTQSPMNFWQGNLKRMQQDPDLKETISCEKIVDPESTMACMDEHSLPV